jgi:copper chaperone NosL
MKKIVLGIVLVSSLIFGFSMDYTKETSCLVRNLKVYKEPKWVSKVELTNGKEVYFSSPKAMFEFYFLPGQWFDVGVKSEKDFKQILVTDFSNMQIIKAKSSFFVYGSNVTSPGGDDLVPFASYKEAQKFAQEHNGKRILSFQEVSDALIRLINGRI